MQNAKCKIKTIKPKIQNPELGREAEADYGFNW